MSENLRWKANGLPRKGWILHDVIDTEELANECEWCGTTIRYVHYLKHPEEENLTKCGIICAEHLTNDYVGHRLKEKEVKRKKKAELALFKKFMRKGYGVTKSNNLFLTWKEHFIVFRQTEKNIQLIINGIFGKRSYKTLEEAKISAYSFISKLKCST